MSQIYFRFLWIQLKFISENNKFFMRESCLTLLKVNSTIYYTMMFYYNKFKYFILI